MKKSCPLILILACIFFNTFTSYTQCVPDTINCIDTLAPGQICPDSLPDGYVNKPYQVDITVIPPSKIYSIIDTVDIIKIMIDSVGNLPPGLSYEANSDEFYADTVYCILLSGTPLTPGTYDLSITVTPFMYIELFCTVVQGNPQVDDTSLTITIHSSSSLDNLDGRKFYVVGSTPNPFQNTTKIEFFSTLNELVELRVYNLLGQIVYQETTAPDYGMNYFRFTGQDLKEGSYIYTVLSKNNRFTYRFVKLE